METAPLKSMKILGQTGILADNIASNWLIGIRETNPAIINIFKDRDLKPYRDLLPWSGEFAGKYITGAYFIYRSTGNMELYAYVMSFIDELLGCIAPDGYIGCYQERCRLTGAYSQNPDATGATWDAWSHYHIMYGLYLWHEQTGDNRLLEAVEKIAQLFLSTFYKKDSKRLCDIGWTEMNLAPYHIFAILYEKTGNKDYLDFALQIEKDMASEQAGDYINQSLSGLEFWQCPKPRWESLHVIMGIAQMYRCTGDKKYLTSAEHIFRSILRTDVHNTGAFSTNEAAIGNPFSDGAIETCCVIAYSALAVEIFKLTGDVSILDYLELSHYNAVMGYFSPTGSWSTYDTPMEGVKNANYHSIVFQCRPGSPQLNCCSVNAPRGVGMPSDWALTEDDGTVYINFLESLEAVTSDGLSVKIEGAYPAPGAVTVRLESDSVKRVGLHIPGWSKKSYITIDGERVQAQSGKWAFFERKWTGETLTIELDFSVRYLEGDLKYAGKRSIYYGPILMGADVSSNAGIDFENLPPIPTAQLEVQFPSRLPDGRISVKLPCGVTLVDFYRLGGTGAAYKTWFEVKEPPKTTL